MYTKLTIKEEIRILEQMKKDVIRGYEIINNKIEAKDEINAWVFTDKAESIIDKLGDYRTKVFNFYKTKNIKINVVITDKEALSHFFSGTDFRYFPVIMKSENGDIVDANYWDEI